jgi:hypothetical protein
MSFSYSVNFVLLRKYETTVNDFASEKQKVHLFRRTLGFLAEAQPRLTSEGKKHFLAEMHIKFSRRQYEVQTGKIANLFCIKYVDKFINTY